MKASGGKPIRKSRGADVQAPAESAQQGMRAQGVRTRNAIVEVARAILLEGGSLGFSLREVAARAGISISNVQYYFPTKPALLRAVVEPVIDAYLGELKSAIDSDAPPQMTLDALAARALREAKSPESSALWWHFVSFALIDEECSRLLDDWYKALTCGIAQLIRAAYPECSAADSLHRAMLLIAVTDGLNCQSGGARRKRASPRGLDASYLAAANCLLRGELSIER